jgi:parallel beta-helix repeat protein
MPDNLLTINASSTLAQGVGAHVKIIVDGQTIGSTTVGATPADYSFTSPFALTGAHDIQVVYDNDTVVRGQDRNLQLNSITVAGKTVAAASSLEVYHAQGQGDLVGDGAMNWNGTAEFQVPASLFSAQISASAGGQTTAPSPAQSTSPFVPATPTGPGFYVSASGNDGGDGSASHPFASFARALSAMESSGTHNTYVEDGTYALNSTLHLGGGDSGMTFQAAPGASPVLDGRGSLSTLIQLDGANNVTLQGLTFQNADGAAVTLQGASGNNIVGNLFAHNGEGLLLTDGASQNSVSGNELDDSARSAIEVQNGSNANSFDSNVVNGTGAIGTKGGGFFIHGGNDNSISHNLVENTAGIGIGIENWDSTTINVGNKITDNVVRNTNTDPTSGDSGAIYELGRSQVDTQSVISGNYVSGSPTSNGHMVDIYLDDLTSGVTVKNNILTNGGDDTAQVHGGSNVSFQNNIFDLGANSGLSWGQGAGILFQSYGGTGMNNNSVTGNIFTSTSPTPLAYSNIGGSASIQDNFYMDQLSSHFRIDGGGLSDNNPQYGDAQFANAAGGDYSLGGNSGAFAVGFSSIDQSNAGPHPLTAHWYGDLGNLT